MKTSKLRLKMVREMELKEFLVIRLKPEHIDSSRMLIRVDRGKGRKGR